LVFVQVEEQALVGVDIFVGWPDHGVAGLDITVMVVT
jgi:hypothetical protein